MSGPRTKLWRSLFKATALFASLAGIIILLELLDLEHLDERWVESHIQTQGALGIVFYVGVTAVASALGVPRQALSFLGGYAFGAELGALWATIGTTLGCALGVFYARFLGQSLINRLFGRRMRKLNDFLGRAPFVMALSIRFFPVGNNAVTSLVAGISSIPALPFIAGSFVGYIPQNLIFTILGSGMRVEPFWRITLSALLFVLSSAFGYALYARHRAAQVLDDEKPLEDSPER